MVLLKVKLLIELEKPKPVLVDRLMFLRKAKLLIKSVKPEPVLVDWLVAVSMTRLLLKSTRTVLEEPTLEPVLELLQESEPALEEPGLVLKPVLE